MKRTSVDGNNGKAEVQKKEETKEKESTRGKTKKTTTETVATT